MWNLRTLKGFDIDEITIEIFNKYKYALASIGVDFGREDSQYAILKLFWYGRCFSSYYFLLVLEAANK